MRVFLKFLILNALIIIPYNGMSQLAEKGVLDLRNLDSPDNFSVRLNGEWDFYWNKMLYPHNFDKKSKPEPDIYGDVPSYWTDYSGKLKTRKYGYATYHLAILLPDSVNNILALDVPVFDSSFDLWINDSLFFSNGTPGKTMGSSMPGYFPGLKPFTPDSDTLEIIVNVSNFHHRRGGFWLPLKLGSYSKLEREKKGKNSRDYSSISLLGGFALFFLIFFLISPKDRILAFFAIALTGIAMRLLFTSGYLIYDLIDLNWHWTIKFEYISLFLIITGWTGFTNILYPSRFFTISARIITALACVSLLLTLFTPVRVFSYTAPFYQAIFVFLIIYLLYNSASGILKKERVEIAYFIAFFLLTAGLINDIVVSMGKSISGFGYVMPYIVVIFIFMQAVLILYKWVMAYYEKEKLRLQLEFMNRNLEEIISKRTAELRVRSEEIEKQNERIAIQNKQLSETLSIKNKIFSVIAHDLRSPVVNILYMLNLLKEKEYKEKYDTFANSSIEYAQMVINLLENMLVWGRGQEDKIRYAPSRYDLASVILTNLSIFKESADRKDIYINFTQKGNSEGFFDKDLMDIVIRNLLSNAVKYTNRGGRISILLKNRMEEEGDIILKICDNGRGIPEEKLKNLFNSTRMESTPGTENEKGTGLGLLLCNELARINRGTITAESKEGEGTCFIITLPLQKEE